MLSQNVDYIGEVLDKIKHCYLTLNDLSGYELFLIKANQVKQNPNVDLALTQLIDEKDGKIAAQSKLYQQLRQFPNMLTFHRFIYYQINEAEEGSGKESLILLYNMVGEQIKKKF